jgi:hypothetical protein
MQKYQLIGQQSLSYACLSSVQKELQSEKSASAGVTGTKLPRSITGTSSSNRIGLKRKQAGERGGENR